MFRFTTSVTTPKGKHSGSGTITLKHTEGRALTMTVHSDDGSAPKTIALVINGDGSVSPDPSAPQPAATTAPDAAARAFMADVTLAAHVGIAARKSAGASTLDVPVTLTPIGDGTPVPAQLHMTMMQSGSNTQYSGAVSGRTMTKLPPSNGLDPKALAKTVGTGAIAHRAFGPAGRLATAVVMHRKTEQEKKAAAGPLDDTVDLSVSTHLVDGRFHDVTGTQKDNINVAGKAVTIVSEWSFTKQ